MNHSGYHQYTILILNIVYESKQNKNHVLLIVVLETTVDDNLA